MKRWIILLASAALFACGDDPPGTAVSHGAIGTRCAVSTDCASELCLDVMNGEGACTVACSERDDCPAGSNWYCGLPDALEQKLCLCTASDTAERCGDGVDNDCDGHVDDCVVCGERVVHYRSCEGAERPDEPLDAECASDGECKDAFECTNDVCAEGRCQHGLVPRLCESDERCSATSGCEPAEPCASAEDCADDDPCTVEEACNLEAQRCTFALRDQDGDGASDAACGGDDCKDDDDQVRPGMPEVCNDVDDDCDGTRDGPSADHSCPDGQGCSAGACSCPHGLDACDGGCVDLANDEQHCGDCNERCPAGGSCAEGSCACPAFEKECAGACTAVLSDEANCGECGHACPQGATCQGGGCACADGQQACDDLCVDLRSDAAHCGACATSCLYGSECKSSCQSELAWALPFSGGFFQNSIQDVWVGLSDGGQITAALTRTGALWLGDEEVLPAVSSDPYDHDVVVVRLAAGGNVLWTRTFRGTGIYNDYIRSFEVNRNGEALLVVEPSGAFTVGSTSYPEYSGRIAIKLAHDGSIAWSRPLDGERVALDGTGAVYVAGIHLGEFELDGLKVGENSFVNGNYLARLGASTGKALWMRDINTNSPDARALAANERGDVTIAVSGFELISTDIPGAPLFESSPFWMLSLDSSGRYLRGVNAADFGAQLAMAADGSLAWSSEYGFMVAHSGQASVTFPAYTRYRDGLLNRHGIGFDGAVAWAAAEYHPNDAAFPRDHDVYGSSTAAIGRRVDESSEAPAFALQLQQTAGPWGPDLARFAVRDGRIVALVRVTEKLALGDGHYFSQAEGTQAVLMAVDTESAP